MNQMTIPMTKRRITLNVHNSGLLPVVFTDARIVLASDPTTERCFAFKQERRPQ